MNKCRVCIFIEPDNFREDFRDFLDKYGFHFYIYDPVWNQHNKAATNCVPLFERGDTLYECIYNGKVLSKDFFGEVYDFHQFLKKVTIELD